MAELLLEIGTEELPTGLINSITNQIQENIIKKLDENNIHVKTEEIKSFNTPRRIAIIIQGLPEKLDFKTIEVRGPSKEKAFDKDGNPTEVAIGFSKKYNLSPKDLIVKNINDVEYVFAITKSGGQFTKDILSKVLLNSLKETTGNKFMKWGNNDERFVRPIRWILAILNNEVIDFSYAGIKSNKLTRGHRFLLDKENKPIPITIDHPSEYEVKLKRHGVFPSSKERENKILEFLNKATTSINATAGDDKDLLSQVINITEYPDYLLCDFDEDFLKLPACIIETVLKKQQKYFVLRDKNTKLLISKFVVITNGIELIAQENNEQIKLNIKNGNEKVVKARLNDARFFLKEDLKIPFTYESRINQLSKITFQKGLGTMKEKVERIIKLSTYIYEILESQDKKLDCKKEDIIEAAKLCKLDLVSHMVFEMPELQGEIGAIYAKENGFNDKICKGIKEHYLQCPDNLIGAIIGIADKLDNIICFFSIGKTPTGSADPFALRRQAQGIIDSTLTPTDLLKINISKLIDFYTKDVSRTVTIETKTKVKEFLVGRFAFTMQSKYPHDLVTSVCSVGDPLNNLYDTIEKAKILSIEIESGKSDFKTFLVSAKRLVRIVESNINGNLDIKNLGTDYEKQLLRHFEELDKIDPKPYGELLNQFKKLTNPINTFFDKVLVNDPDPKIKQTRQALLKKGKDLFEKICDFNKIQERN